MNPSDNHPLIGDENSVANRKIRNLKKLVVLLSLVLVVLIVVFGIVFIVDESDGDDDDLPNKTNPNTIVNHGKLPAIICGWNFTLAALAGHRQMMGNGSVEIGGTSAVDALEHAGNQCELNPNLCRWSVGFGGSPNDLGQTTLDALLMDAKTMNVGAVGSLYRVKKAISVARKVLDHTSHSLLVGNDATDFARLFNFTIEPNLESPHSQALMAKWRNNSYQPNFFVDFDPYPYKNHTLERKRSIASSSSSGVSFDSHDTLPMVAIDKNGDVACGATTNGLTYKIHGRVGDSPIAGAGAYCDNNVGGAACTGDGDTMMRFLPSYFAVQQLRAGKTPQQAADSALEAMQKFYPKVQGCILVLAKSGEYGAASTANWPLIPFVTQIGAQQDTPQQRCIGGTPEQCLKHLHSN